MIGAAAVCDNGLKGQVHDLLSKLEADVAVRLKQAYAPKSQGPLGSALAAFGRFAAACPSRELFRRPAFRGDLSVSAHNEWTMILFAWFLVSEPSPKTGRPIKAQSMRSYISLVKNYLSFEFAYQVVDSEVRLKRLIKDIVSNEPIANRKKRRGMRRRHLRAYWRLPEARRTDVNAVNNFAALATAWHCLARGGEVAPSVKPSAWKADRQPTRADLSFHETEKGRRYAVLWLRPLKKKTVVPKVPQYIEEHDGEGSDAYAALQRLCEHDPVPASEAARTPLFRRRVVDGRGRARTQHMTVAHLRSLVRRVAKRLGYPSKHEWGAHSLRVGGATDLASTGKASELLLRARGRWASDVAAIYARLTRRAQLAGSRLMQEGRGRDLEELLPDFVQPA